MARRDAMVCLSCRRLTNQQHESMFVYGINSFLVSIRYDNLG